MQSTSLGLCVPTKRGPTLSFPPRYLYLSYTQHFGSSFSIFDVWVFFTVSFVLSSSFLGCLEALSYPKWPIPRMTMPVHASTSPVVVCDTAAPHGAVFRLHFWLRLSCKGDAESTLEWWFSFLRFLWNFLALFLYFLYITFPPNFIAPASPHTLSNPLSLRFCICVSLSLPVITFCSPGLCRLTHYPLLHIFIARWHTRYLRIHTFIYLWTLFISPLCPSFNLAVSLWFPG